MGLEVGKVGQRMEVTAESLGESWGRGDEHALKLGCDSLGAVSLPAPSQFANVVLGRLHYSKVLGRGWNRHSVIS